MEVRQETQCTDYECPQKFKISGKRHELNPRTVVWMFLNIKNLRKMEKSKIVL
jgi:hypothetical protein